MSPFIIRDNCALRIADFMILQKRDEEMIVLYVKY